MGLNTHIYKVATGQVGAGQVARAAVRLFQLHANGGAGGNELGKPTQSHPDRCMTVAGSSSALEPDSLPGWAWRVNWVKPIPSQA